MSEAEKIAAELLRVKVLFQARTLATIIGATMLVLQRFPPTRSNGAEHG